MAGGSFQPFEKLWAFRAQEGHVTLDDYKDWVLDWPADPEVTYPRLLFGREDVERLKARADAFHEGELFKRFLYVNDTDARRRELWQKLTSDNEWNGPSGTAGALLSRGDPANIPWAIGYRVSQMTGWAGDMDELLGSGRLTPEQRARLRSDLAVFCYAASEPDVNPRGAMTHLGNPNMPINRFMGLAWAAALIPDHPMRETWLYASAQYLRYKLAMNTASGGTWGELISYYDASAPHLIQTAGVLARTGRMDDVTARLAVDPAVFTLNLLTPGDPRFDARLIPGWGHEGMSQGTRFGQQTNTGGWPGGGALGGTPWDGFNDSVDYVRGVSDEGPRRWSRQIAFVKSRSPQHPSYFVFRDSFAPRHGAKELQQKWWYLRTLGRKDQVRPGAGELNYTSEFGPRLNVHFLEPAKVQVESRDATQRALLYHVNASNRRRVQPQARRDGDPTIDDMITGNAVGPIDAAQDLSRFIRTRRTRPRPDTSRWRAAWPGLPRASRSTTSSSTANQSGSPPATSRSKGWRSPPA